MKNELEAAREIIRNLDSNLRMFATHIAQGPAPSKDPDCYECTRDPKKGFASCAYHFAVGWLEVRGIPVSQEKQIIVLGARIPDDYASTVGAKHGD